MAETEFKVACVIREEFLQDGKCLIHIFIAGRCVGTHLIDMTKKEVKPWPSDPWSTPETKAT